LVTCLALTRRPSLARPLRAARVDHLGHRFGKDGTAAPLPMPEPVPAAEEGTAA